MVDDLTLEQLLGDAADAIAVPPGGPGRVLATRDATSPVRTREPQPQRARRRPSRFAAALAVSAAVVGVGAAVVASGGGSGPSGSASHSASIAGRAPAFGGQATSSGAGAAALPASPSAGGAQQSTPNLLPGATQAKVVKTGSMTLQVASVQSSLDRLGFLAGSAGGYVASTTANVPGGGQPATGDITLRVPEASFESLVSQVRALGTASKVTLSGQDVTSQYSDLKARLQALQSTINQLQLIETKAQTIGDVLAVEQQISAQQTQADQIQGQINVLDDETTYGSLSVHLSEQQKKASVAPPPSGISKAWDHARHSFVHGLESVIGALGGIAVFLLFAGLVIAIARLGWTAVRRRLV